jgi:hypothetical protein
MQNPELTLRRLAIIKEIVTRLGDVGKTKIQKIVYFLQEAVGIPLVYPFKMHHYGPYSDDLDGDLSLAQAVGLVNIAPDMDGFGYHVTPGQDWGEALRLPELEARRKSIENAIDNLGSLEIADLELHATVHFVGNLDLEKRLTKEEVLSTVRSLKPKFSIQQIDSAYQSLQKAGLVGK